MSTATIHQGDALEVLRGLPADSFDALLSDPPYGISFMSRKWDHGVPSSEVWAEALRVLKPGAFLFVFGGTRTYHRLAVAIEDAGFEIRDSILACAWTYGTGFPKSLDISADLRRRRRGWRGPAISNQAMRRPLEIRLRELQGERSTDGWGVALKPSWEPVVVAMKPLDGTFAENALEHGVAGLNVDGGRIAASTSDVAAAKVPMADTKICSPASPVDAQRADGSEIPVSYRNPNGELHDMSAGRWPSNLILSHHPECRRVGTRKVKTGTAVRHRSGGRTIHSDTEKPALDDMTYADPDGTETVPAYECHEDCPVAAVDRQSGESVSTPRTPSKSHHTGFATSFQRGSETSAHSDSGGASRFYFQAEWESADHDFLAWHAKASTAERELGMRPGERCKHPTLKPISLTAYLATLLLPPKRDGEPRRLLVPFSGAGSEIIGALRAGWEEVVGIELEEESVEWAEARIRGDAPLLNQVEVVGEKEASA